MPDISRLVIEVDSKGVLAASGNLEAFNKSAVAVGKSADGLVEKFSNSKKETNDLANKLGEFQLVANRLPGPLKSVASGLMGLVSPGTAVISVIIELTDVVVKFSKESVIAFQEQEVQLARLGAVLEATGAKAWTTSKDLQNMSVSLQESTGRSANEIKQMQSVLLGFTNITGENFERLTRNMIDMADVMGGSLVASANTFGKALDTPTESISALTRYGFKFTEEQKRMIKALEDTGNIAEAQVVILESMEKAFGGSAEATRDATRATRDYELAMGKLKTTFGENVANDPLVKWWQSVKTESVEALVAIIEYMNVRNSLGRAYKAVESGNATDDQELWVAQRKIARLREYIEDYHVALNNIFRRPFIKESYLAQANEMLSEAIEQERIIRDRIIEARALEQELYKLEQNRQSRSSKIAEIEAQYENTEEGRVISAENQINKLLELRDRVWEVDTGVFEGLSDKHKRMIDIIIEDTKKVKRELTGWQEIFKSSMRLSDNDTRQDWFKRQSTSIAEFTKMLAMANDRAKILSDTFKTDMTDSLERAALAWEDIASNMIMSGEWQSDTELFLRVVEYAREARDAFNEANLDNLISDLETELSLLQMTTMEMERQRLIIEFKVSNEEKINQALERQNKLRREQEKLNVLSSVSGLSNEDLIGLSGRDLYDRINGTMTTKFIDALGFSEMGLADYAHELGEIADEWERIYKTILSATTLKDGVFVQLFDPTLEENAELIDRVYKAMMEAREQSTKAGFDDAMKELDLRQEIVNLSKEDLRIRQLAEAFGDENRAREYRTRERNIDGEEAYVEDKGLLEEKQRIIWLSEERLRIEELTDRYVTDARAREIYALEQQIEKTLALKEALATLQIAGLNIVSSGLLDFARDLGSAFRDGTISSYELSGALGNMVRAMIDAMPQLLLNVGLQLVMAKQWALGLAFIGASGLMGFVSGMIEDANDSGRDDEAERLRRIRDQITDLINQQRKQAEYYATKKRSVDSTSQQVNDAVITPKGVVYTHPEDWIIATKRPDKFGDTVSGGNVYINIENNAPVKVNAESEKSDDGSKAVRITIEQIVQAGIANGSFDGAFNAMNNRVRGRKVVT